MSDSSALLTWSAIGAIRSRIGSQAPAAVDAEAVGSVHTGHPAQAAVEEGGGRGSNEAGKYLVEIKL